MTVSSELIRIQSTHAHTQDDNTINMDTISTMRKKDTSDKSTKEWYTTQRDQKASGIKAYRLGRYERVAK